MVVHTQPLIDRQIINVDLIPYGLREDQRRLPPGIGIASAFDLIAASLVAAVFHEPPCG